MRTYKYVATYLGQGVVSTYPIEDGILKLILRTYRRGTNVILETKQGSSAFMVPLKLAICQKNAAERSASHPKIEEHGYSIFRQYV